jgi:hypothetical protein
VPYLKIYNLPFPRRLFSRFIAGASKPKERIAANINEIITSDRKSGN